MGFVLFSLDLAPAPTPGRLLCKCHRKNLMPGAGRVPFDAKPSPFLALFTRLPARGGVRNTNQGPSSYGTLTEY